MKHIFLSLLLSVGSVLFWTCKKPFTGYTEETAIVKFEQSEVTISDTVVEPTPIVIALSTMNFYSDFTIYVSVDDTQDYIKNNLMSLSNEIFKAPDYLNGDSLYIYKVVVAKGTKVAALMVTPQINELEKVPHSLTFNILPDTSQALQRKGAKFYEVDNKNSQVKITIKPN